MSFGIYLQAFTNGCAVERDAAVIRRLLLAHADAHAPEHDFAHVTYGEGGADVYGVPADDARCGGLMFNHVDSAVFELLVNVSELADLVVMPVGCPVCVVSESQVEHLPSELRDRGVEVIGSGRELADVIARSQLGRFRNEARRALPPAACTPT